MQARMKNPAILLPEAMQALLALSKSTEAAPRNTVRNANTVHSRQRGWWGQPTEVAFLFQLRAGEFPSNSVK